MSRHPKGRGRPVHWERGLIITKSGTPSRNVANVLHVLSQHPAWKDVVAYDEFSERVITLRPAPVRVQDAPISHDAGEWTEADSVRTAAWLATHAGFEPSVATIDAAVIAAAGRRAVHPVRDWLAGLSWDGVARLDWFLSRYLGAEQTEYAAAVGARWMTSGVARVWTPGCKADHVLVLEGPQGRGKSTALRILASDRWFADTGLVLGDKDSYQNLRGVWVYELSELSGIRGRDAERIKSFLSSPADRYRPSYGRYVRVYPRQTVFAATTNEHGYLRDPSGGRRFWPVRCGRADLEALARDREQLWAEAVARYRAGEPWHLDAPNLVFAAGLEQQDRFEHDDWEDIISGWLSTARRAGGFSTTDVLIDALGFQPSRIQKADSKRVGHVLRRLGYTPRQFRREGKRCRLYFPVESTGEAEAVTRPVTPPSGETHPSHMSQVSQAAKRELGERIDLCGAHGSGVTDGAPVTPAPPTNGAATTRPEPG